MLLVIICEGYIEDSVNMDTKEEIDAFQCGLSFGSNAYGAGDCYALTEEDYKELVKEDDWEYKRKGLKEDIKDFFLQHTGEI